jgi:hypothetical protein
MATLLGVEGAKGGNGAPSIGQVAGIGVGERHGRGSEIEGRARKYCCEIASKAGTIPGEKGGNMCHVVGEKVWRPCRKASC